MSELSKPWPMSWDSVRRRSMPARIGRLIRLAGTPQKERGAGAIAEEETVMNCSAPTSRSV